MVDVLIAARKVTRVTAGWRFARREAERQRSRQVACPGGFEPPTHSLEGCTPSLLTAETKLGENPLLQ